MSESETLVATQLLDLLAAARHGRAVALLFVKVAASVCTEAGRGERERAWKY